MATDLDHDLKQAIARLPGDLRPIAGLWAERFSEHIPGRCTGHGAQPDPAHLVRLAAVSDFASQALLRHWDWFLAAHRSGELEHAPQSPTWIPADTADDAVFMKSIRDFRNRTLLHILWRDLIGRADVTETLGSLTELAERSIVAARQHGARQLAVRFGTPRDERGEVLPLVVLAMGKLGGRELNFSSDIDVIFLYPGDGETDGRRAVSAQEYFTRLARRIVGLLEEVTADGFVYRVDTRLRPFGDSGPPVVSYAALESYLVKHGRSWERYAYIKARVIDPDPDLAAAIELRQQLIDPFVYRRYLDFGVFESLREMKSLIEAEVRRREMAQNVKLGPGGIREIEFIAQSLQLVRGGNVRQLRTTGLLQALSQLVERRGLARAVAVGLEASYRFLRKLENCLQAIRDQQTHELPGNVTERARISLAMDAPDWQALSAQIATHRNFVSTQFAAVAFRGSDDQQSDTSDLIGTIARRYTAETSAEGWQTVFARFKFDEPDAVAGVLAHFLASSATRQIDTPTRRRLQSLLPAMLSRLRDRRQPAVTLKRLLGIIGQVLRRSAYVALLNENTAVLGRLVDLCEQSAWLADEIARFPVLLDELLDPRLYSSARSTQALRDDLQQRIAALGDADSERQVEVLGQFQRAALFRIGVADFSGELPVMKVSDRLTDLAEIVLEHALQVAWSDLVKRFGEPCFVENKVLHAAGMGVIAYGKLGGIELSYGSDLDLIFLHNSRADEQQTNGAKSLDNNTFFARLARRLVHFLTVQTGSGALYDVDTRLRPSGRAGLLVISCDAFERYQAENAWTWEHQALLRGRPVAGSLRIAREFERIRTHTLAKGVNRNTLQEDVRAMREKMRVQLDKSDDTRFDLKQGAGGIGDIEFLVQYLVLLHAAHEPAVMHYSDNIRQLGALGAAGYLETADVTRLQDIYKAYRTEVHRQLLDEREPLAGIELFAAERDSVRDLWQRLLQAPG